MIVRGQGQNFCAGIDLESLQGVVDLMQIEDRARGNAHFRRKILKMQVHVFPHSWMLSSLPLASLLLEVFNCSQESFNAIEECRWPVIAAVQGKSDFVISKWVLQKHCMLTPSLQLL